MVDRAACREKKKEKKKVGGARLLLQGRIMRYSCKKHPYQFPLHYITFDAPRTRRAHGCPSPRRVPCNPPSRTRTRSRTHRDPRRTPTDPTTPRPVPPTLTPCRCKLQRCTHRSDRTGGANSRPGGETHSRAPVTRISLRASSSTLQVFKYIGIPSLERPAWPGDGLIP